MKTPLVTLLCCLSLSALVPAVARANPEVEKQVRALAAELQRAWDTRDIDAYMALFAKPEGFLVGGGTSRTLDSMKTSIVDRWANRTSETSKPDEVRVVVLSNSAALLQIMWSGRFTLKTGAIWEFKSSDFGTYLVRKIGRQWKIVASHESARGNQVNAAKKK